MDGVEFRLGILYSTIAVLQPNEDFNDWNDTHVGQGFSWRATSVSFGTLSDEPESNIIVKTSSNIEASENAERIIIVPFIVGKDGVEIASVADSQQLDITEGSYELMFSAFKKANEESIETYEFVFIKSENPKARILKADKQLNPPEKLLMVANPAI